MRKGALSLFIILISLAFASAKASCSDGSKVNFDQNEVDVGSAKTINGIGIGLTRTEERVFYRRIIADLIIDARRVELSNNSNSEKIDLLGGSYTVSLGNVTETTAKIIIEGETKNLEEGTVDTIKGLFIMLSSAGLSNDALTSIAKLIVGTKQISLSNDLHPAEKISFGNTTYLVELTSASDSNAFITVSICKTGEILYENLANKTNEISNQTSNASVINETIMNRSTDNEENNTENQSSKQVTVAEMQERLRKLNESQSNETNESGAIIEKQGEKTGFFRRIWNWIKGLFS